MSYEAEKQDVIFRNVLNPLQNEGKAAESNESESFDHPAHRVVLHLTKIGVCLCN